LKYEPSSVPVRTGSSVTFNGCCVPNWDPDIRLSEYLGPAISASQFAPSSLNTDIVNYGLWLGPGDHEKTVWSKSPIVRIPDIPHSLSSPRRTEKGRIFRNPSKGKP